MSLLPDVLSPDYAAGLAAERAGQPCKRWQTKPWRDGWAQARSERREREFQAHEDVAHEDVLEEGPCQDQDCPYPYCAESRERIAAGNAEVSP